MYLSFRAPFAPAMRSHHCLPPWSWDSASVPASAEDIKLRIASGHPAVNTYVNLMQTFFVPEVTKRVAERTKHKVEFIEGYGGSMVKVADTLEGVQSGIIDVGGYCFCFEPSNLPLHAFQVMLPFGTMSPEKSVKLARAVYDKVPALAQDLRGQVQPGADRPDRRQRLQPHHHLRVEHGRRPQGPQARRRRPQSQVAGICRRGAGAVVAAGGLHLAADRRLQRLDHVPVRRRQLQAARSVEVLHRDRLRRDHLARPDHQQGALRQAAEGGAGHHRSRSAANTRPRPAPSTRRTIPSSSSSSRPPAPWCASCRTASRVDWATSLKGWPQEKADELDKAGLPASQVLKLALEEAEKPATSGRCATR